MKYPTDDDLVKRLRNEATRRQGLERFDTLEDEAADRIEALEAMLRAVKGRRHVLAVDLLDNDIDYYSNRDGQLDGIPFKQVAHICSLMRKRLAALEPAPDHEIWNAAIEAAAQAMETRRPLEWGNPAAIRTLKKGPHDE